MFQKIRIFYINRAVPDLNDFRGLDNRVQFKRKESVKGIPTHADLEI